MTLDAKILPNIRRPDPAIFWKMHHSYFTLGKQGCLNVRNCQSISCFQMKGEKLGGQFRVPWVLLGTYVRVAGWQGRKVSWAAWGGSGGNDLAITVGPEVLRHVESDGPHVSRLTAPGSGLFGSQSPGLATASGKQLWNTQPTLGALFLRGWTPQGSWKNRGGTQLWRMTKGNGMQTLPLSEILAMTHRS